MGHLIAKIKNRHKAVFEAYKIIITDKDCFALPTTMSSVPYSPSTLLGDGQWYKIDNFSGQAFCLELLKQDGFDSVNFQLLDNSDFPKIDYLCSVQDDVFFFQKVRPSQLIKKKRLIFGDTCRYDENNASIVVNYYADAMYIKSEDALYFQKLETVATIFKGIDTLFREATEQETIEFLNSTFIALDDGMDSKKVGKSSRKSVALAMTVLNSFSSEERKRVFEYTQNYTDLRKTGDSFVISSEDDLKKLMWGILERYYQTPVSGQQRLANSVIDLVQNN